MGGNRVTAGGEVGGDKFRGGVVGGVVVEGRYGGWRPIPGTEMWLE